MTLKNLFLLTAVIGCGLFATVLKTSKSGQLARAEQEQQVIFVPAKDLFVGTKLEKEKLAEFIKKKWVSKTEVPPNAILNEDVLIGATVTRNLKADDCFLTPYVSRHEGLMPPSGKHLYTLKLPYESVGPWVQPGKEVDVVCKHQTPGSQVVRHFRLLHKMPVLAVDYDKLETNSTGKPIIYTVTLEVGLYEASWLQMAQDAEASLSLLVRSGHEVNICGLPDEELYELFKGPAKETKNREETAKSNFRSPSTATLSPNGPFRAVGSTVLIRFGLRVRLLPMGGNTMTTLKLKESSLLKAERNASSSGYKTIDEYVEDLIDRDIEYDMPNSFSTKEELEALILEA